MRRLAGRIKVVRRLHEFQHVHRRVEHLVVHARQPLDVVVGGEHRLLPLLALALEERCVDAALELVLVGLVDEPAEAVVAAPGVREAGFLLAQDVHAGLA
ncbi:MAG: hypothetical protein Q8P18_27070 [Pseudomonadota bacterium]|nr:hypothetical protein [Pseudomonadota bacterium]